ncbi:magnesium transporter NIPA1-like [Photinus pyralis]|uniref:magnesium transporter NIPA1-like n=1 Tax=Photinus pyralis TaxID=7054 RepID=UPI00126781FF|nr:magnesium transporter NIPA1-like [Photinus pyralis]
MILQADDRFWLGFCFAILANVLLAITYTVKKRALTPRHYVSLDEEGEKHIHYKDGVFWAYLILLLISGVVNFVAYSMAPAFLVAATGIVGMFLTSVSFKLYFDEKYNHVSGLGVCFAILGLAIMVLNYPRGEVSMNILDLASLMYTSGFVYYVLVVILLWLITAGFIVPSCQTKNVSVYIIFTLLAYSFIGSATIIACKCAGYSIKYLIIYDEADQTNVLYMLLFLVTMLVGLWIQEYYMGKFSESFSSPGALQAIFFILRTALVAVFSEFLFNEWSHVHGLKIAGASLGFVLICVSALMHPLFSDLSFDDTIIADKFRPK